MIASDRLVLALFARHDPLHLISIGAPADEYAHEVRRILSRSHEASDESQLRRILHEEFVRCFSAPLWPAPSGATPPWRTSCGLCCRRKRPIAAAAGCNPSA